MSYDKQNSLKVLEQPLTEDRFREMMLEDMAKIDAINDADFKKQRNPNTGFKLGSYNSKNKNRCQTK